jgi:hypothetical protein
LFSQKTLKKADWPNTKVIKENIVEEIRNEKATRQGYDDAGQRIITQFAEQGLIDEYQMMIEDGYWQGHSNIY